MHHPFARIDSDDLVYCSANRTVILVVTIFAVSAISTLIPSHSSAEVHRTQSIVLPYRHTAYSRFLIHSNNESDISQLQEPPEISDNALIQFELPLIEAVASSKDDDGKVYENIASPPLFSSHYIIDGSNSSPEATHSLLPESILIQDIKHFVEPVHTSHLDARFAQWLPSAHKLHYKHLQQVETVSKRARRELAHILHVFSSICKRYDFSFWIAHGSLLAWYWNQHMFPWDDDMDVQMPIRDLQSLSNEFNNTRFDSSGVPSPKGRFLLDVNPNFAYRGVSLHNFIDARLIDMRTGRFLDITAVADVEGNGVVMDKSPHVDRVLDLLPLMETVFEGVLVWRPWNAMDILVREYPNGLNTSEFFGHRFDESRREWIPKPKRSWFLTQIFLY